jgi:hypothetical protein
MRLLLFPVNVYFDRLVGKPGNERSEEPVFAFDPVPLKSELKLLRSASLKLETESKEKRGELFNRIIEQIVENEGEIAEFLEKRRRLIEELGEVWHNYSITMMGGRI